MKKMQCRAIVAISCAVFSTACVDPQPEDGQTTSDGWQIGETSNTETANAGGPINSAAANGDRHTNGDSGTATGPVSIDPQQWEIWPNDFGAGVHTVWMIVEVNPAWRADITGLSAQLIWEGTQVDLCASLNPDEFISIRDELDDALIIGDGFQSNEQGPGCAINEEMASAFDIYGFPATACISVETRRGDVEYCGPLAVGGM